MIPYEEYSDTQLGALLRQGDRLAFAMIYNKFVAELYHYARMNVPVREDCEALVGKVFESLWDRRETIEGPLHDHLLKSMRFIIISYIRTRGIHKRYMEHYRNFAIRYDLENR